MCDSHTPAARNRDSASDIIIVLCVCSASSTACLLFSSALPSRSKGLPCSGHFWRASAFGAGMTAIRPHPPLPCNPIHTRLCQALLDMLEVYYWHTPAAGSFGRFPMHHQVSGEVIGERPGENGVKLLRGRVLKLLNLLAGAKLTSADSQVGGPRSSLPHCLSVLPVSYLLFVIPLSVYSVPHLPFVRRPSSPSCVAVATRSCSSTC